MFFKYLKSHLKTIFLFLLFCVVFCIVFYLYALPVSSVLYAGVICAFIGAVFVVCGYIRMLKKHKLLERMKKEIRITAENMPIPDNIIESDYADIITSLYDEKQSSEDMTRRKYEDMIEYYTLWVHQIKTPIAAMRLRLQSEDTSESREQLEELQKIEQYVEMVLTYLRLNNESDDYVIKKNSLDSILCQAVRKYSNQFIRRRITLNYEPVNCSVLTDEKWLLFVVEQVLSNALKYTKSGSVSITLEQPKTLCITDTGIGIAQEDLPRIFEKGFTGYNGRLDTKASGLGLYLCRRICNNLGHRICAESDGISGTVIKIDLECAKIEIE